MDSAPNKLNSPSTAATTEKILLTFAEAGELLGIKERKAHDVVTSLVTPVVLGPRCVRIVRSELEAAVANLPRQLAAVEPEQLKQARVARQYRMGKPV